MRERKDINFGKEKAPAEIWLGWSSELTRQVFHVLGDKARPDFINHNETQKAA